jgi:TRAP-type C4-dicarboxylate transport system permease large subunit
VGCAIGKVSIEKVSKAMIPYYLTMFVVLMLVTYIPDITMFLPNLIMPGG